MREKRREVKIRESKKEKKRKKRRVSLGFWEVKTIEEKDK